MASNKISFGNANSKSNIEKIVTEKTQKIFVMPLVHVPESIDSFQYKTS